jgi:hypothetical protein
VLLQKIRRCLLHELEAQVTNSTILVQKRRQSLMRVIFRIVDQHDREGGA